MYYGKSTKLSGRYNVSTSDLKIYGSGYTNLLDSIIKVGDLDGNGYSDLVLGARGTKNSDKVSTGGVYIKHLDGSRFTGKYNISKFYDKIIYGTQSISYFGINIIDTGDFDRDGNADFAVSAYRQDTGSKSQTGAVYIFNGNKIKNGSSASDASITIYGEEAGDRFGFSFTQIDDFNLDGTQDIAISTEFASGATSTLNDGVVYLIESGLNQSEIYASNIKTKITEPYSYENLGVDLDSSGDINGDGKIDLLIGASNARSRNGTILAMGKAYILTEYYPEKFQTITETVTNIGSNNSTTSLEKGFFESLPISPVSIFLSLFVVAVVFNKRRKY